MECLRGIPEMSITPVGIDFTIPTTLVIGMAKAMKRQCGGSMEKRVEALPPFQATRITRIVTEVTLLLWRNQITNYVKWVWVGFSVFL